MKQKEEQSFSLKEYYPFVGKIVSRYCFDNNIREDLFQSGIVGLMNAAAHYDKSFHTAFASYAFPYIKGEILSTLAQIKGKKKDFYRSEAKISLSEFSSAVLSDISLDESETLTETTAFADEQSELMFQKADQRILITHIFGKLAKSERRLLYYRYFLNLNQKETGKFFQVSQSEISRREKEIIKKIRNLI